MELTVISQVVPRVEFNKEEIKKHLQNELEKYSNLVVTNETATDDKKKRAELNNLRKSVDKFRKDTKNKISEPIKSFEDDCKEVIGLINRVIDPIDRQLKEIEEKEKEEKKNEINQKIKEIIEEYQLDEKHASQLTINASYLNKTNKMPKITTDLKNRAEVLKVAQNAIIQNKEFILKTCEMCNNAIKQPMDSKIWVRVYENNGDVNKTIEMMHDSTREQQQKEQAAEVAETLNIAEAHEPKHESERQIEIPTIQPPKMEEPKIHAEPIKLCEEATEGPILEATLRFYGTMAQMNTLKKVMESIGIKYEKVNL